MELLVCTSMSSVGGRVTKYVVNALDTDSENWPQSLHCVHELDSSLTVVKKLH